MDEFAGGLIAATSVEDIVHMVARAALDRGIASGKFAFAARTLPRAAAAWHLVPRPAGPAAP